MVGMEMVGWRPESVMELCLEGIGMVLARSIS
jgi:hypothetical protein